MKSFNFLMTSLLFMGASLSIFLMAVYHAVVSFLRLVCRYPLRSAFILALLVIAYQRVVIINLSVEREASSHRMVLIEQQCD